LKNFLSRSIFGAIYVALIVVSLLVDAWAVLLVFCLLAYFTIREFNALVHSKFLHFNGIPTYILGFTGLFLGYLVQVKELNPGYYLLLILPLLFSFISMLYRKTEFILEHMGALSLSAYYIVLPLSLLFVLLYRNGTYNFEILLGYFILIWSSDSFAYVFGMLFGKHRLFERISPKKSWEGAIGGTLLTLAVAYLISLFFTSITLSAWLTIAAVVIVFGIYGDLIESALKRGASIKDSGNIIPGHGGVLDRLDSMLISLPVVVLVLMLIFGL
jgi:phosphatidate cytidylyltransferase